MTVSTANEWDAATYHRVSNTHVSWGRTVLDRLPLRGDETVVDAGCGSGRLTAELLERLPAGRVVAVDRSRNMLDQAAQHLRPRFGDRVALIRSDLLDLKLDRPADAIFSTATFRWITDHDALFRTMFANLRPGGRLIAQCGGGPNIARLMARIAALAEAEPFARSLRGWDGPWEFATPAKTAGRLTGAGFVEVETWLEPTPVTMTDVPAYREFLRAVIIHPYLDRMDDPAGRDALLDRLTAAAAADDPPYTFDYWRLNLAGRRPATVGP